MKPCKISRHLKSCTSALFLFFILTSYINAQKLRIYHIDVEQADATLFVSPDNKTLLVDSGKNGHGSRLKAVMHDAGVDTIHYFVCTHYHEDHYGGIDDLVLKENVTVIESYDRGGKQFLPAEKIEGETFKGYQQAVGERAKHLMRGETIPFNTDISVTCISSGGAVLGEIDPKHGINENDMSISILIQYEEFRYFMGGDIEQHTEKKIADHDLVLDIDVYQTNHHGSHTSSSSAFIQDLKPSVVIISNGNHSTYQHPRQSTLDFFSGMNPKPTVLQTNKYFKGVNGGNVNDEFIADLESDNTNGTILITVDLSTANYSITYRDKELIFPIKVQNVPSSLVVIESLLPNPMGPDRKFEEVTLRNKSNIDVSLAGWLLKNKSGRVWTLSAVGVILSGESVLIKRNGMPMSLNNSSDEINLIDASNKLQDSFNYTGSQEGVRIQTGH